MQHSGCLIPPAGYSNALFQRNFGVVPNHRLMLYSYCSANRGFTRTAHHSSSHAIHISNIEEEENDAPMDDPNWTQWCNTIMTEENDEKIEKLVEEIKEIFRSMNDGETSPSAYDTAWVARVPSLDDKNTPQFPETLDWILKNQHEEGSWGEPSYFLLHDRLVCTLACVLALKIWGIAEDHINKGLKFLSTHIKYLREETASIRTCGFEIIFPSMLHEAKRCGFELPYDEPCLIEIVKLREKKINKIPLEMMHSVHTTLLYSLEALQDVVDWERILKLQSRDGSFLSSPSSTAIAYIMTGDSKCFEFLNYIVQRFGDYAPTQYPIDLLERIWAVDVIQRLGIHHHFRSEISEVLDYIYRHVGKQGASWGRDNPINDIDDTCMALRLLRLHGHQTSSDVLNYFRDNTGNFICFPGQIDQGVSDMFNLYRFSQISFPGEKILKDARAFVEPYLQNYVDNNLVDDKWSLKKALNKEVGHAMRYPWKMSFPRLEAREFINNYGTDDVWIAKTIYLMYNVNNGKYLELAKLDYNRMQPIYKREIKEIIKWLRHYGYYDSSRSRLKLSEIHFSIAATLYEPEFTACRIVYTKCNYIENILKDIFECYHSRSDLQIFCQAVEQWNPALVEELPLELKVAFIMMYNTLNEVAAKATNDEGKDVFPYLYNIRLKQIHGYMRYVEDRENKHFTSFQECVNQGKKVVGAAIRLLPAMFFLGEHLDDVLQLLNQQSWTDDQLALFLTLMSDVNSYQDKYCKDPANAICYYMDKENFTEIESVDHIKNMIDDVFDELIHQYLQCSHVPQNIRRLIFEHARIAQFFLAHSIDPQIRTTIVGNSVACLFTPV